MNSIVEIPLTQGAVALVDPESYDIVSEHKWHLMRTAGRHVYARTNVRGLPRSTNPLLMHTLLLRPSAGLVVDHIDGNGLNNTLSNLRVCTRKQNLQNRRVGSGRFKGVTLR